MGFRSALLFLFGRYKHLNGRPSSLIEMVLGAGLEPARVRLAGTSPCLRYSESHGAERYNSGSSQRASAGVSSRRQTWLSNPSLCAGGQKPSDPYISRPDIAAVHLPSAFFRVSSRFAAPSRQVITPAASLPFPPAQVKSWCPAAGFLHRHSRRRTRLLRLRGSPLGPLRRASRKTAAQCGSRTRDRCVDQGGRMQCLEPYARSTD